jgi:NAD+ synthase
MLLARLDSTRELQTTLIEEMGIQPRIDPAGEVRKRDDFLKEYLKATQTKGFVRGISGGLDSSLAGRLAQARCGRAQG